MCVTSSMGPQVAVGSAVEEMGKRGQQNVASECGETQNLVVKKKAQIPVTKASGG